MSKSPTERSTLHPMRIVVQRTGLTPDLLRAWEKRYQVVEPTRSPGGQRYYTDADVELLRLLVRATRNGRSIGQVARLTRQELERIVEKDEQAVLAPENTLTSPDGRALDTFLSSALIAVERFDGPALEHTLRTAALRLPADDVLDAVIGPLLFTIGSLWHQGLMRPANEHLATTTIRRVLGWMADLAPPSPGSPVLVVGTPANQLHELGAMLAATTASGRGWRVIYLGANLPAEELANAAVMARADALAISVVYPSDDPALIDELRRLRAALPSSVTLLVGGSGVDGYAAVLAEIGAEVFPNLTGMRSWLRRRGVTA